MADDILSCSGSKRATIEDNLIDRQYSNTSSDESDMPKTKRRNMAMRVNEAVSEGQECDNRSTEEPLSDTTGKKNLKKKGSKASCCVPLCTRPGYVTEHGQKVTFHVLPLHNKELLDKWIVKIRRDEGCCFKVSKSTRICSRHFRPDDLYTTPSGRRRVRNGAIPTRFVWIKEKGRRILQRKTCSASADNGTTCQVDPSTCTAPNIPNDSETDTRLLHEKIASLEAEVIHQKQRMLILEKERNHVRDVLAKNVEKHKQSTFGIERFKEDDKDISYYTGFPTYTAFYQCYRLLNPAGNIIFYNSTGRFKLVKETKLSYMNQFFLTLVRLRLGLLEKDLAHRFSISQTSVNRYFVSWVNFIYLRFGSINIWPSKTQIQRTMPDSMKEKFPNLEWIIDAFEMQTQRPRSLLLQSQSYSSYKSRNTVKGLVACTPSGQIGFMSQLYTGNISDRELVKRSGFLQMPHTPGAMWLVDKGFQIADLAEPLGVSINMPAFMGNKKQMSATEVFHTQSIASERIHIERAINKVKKFHYFDRPIPLSTLGTTNQAWAVCTMLTLFQNPIISA